MAQENGWHDEKIRAAGAEFSVVKGPEGGRPLLMLHEELGYPGWFKWHTASLASTPSSSRAIRVSAAPRDSNGSPTCAISHRPMRDSFASRTLGRLTL